jgi:pilus assembly protein TadC
MDGQARCSGGAVGMTPPTMTALVAASCAGAAVGTWPRARPQRRLERVSPGGASGGRRRSRRSRWSPRLGSTDVTRLRAHAAGSVAALSVGLLVGGVAGVVASLIVLVGIPVVVGRLEPASVRQDKARIAADLPLALDLLAACLGAGAPLATALTVVADALGGPLGARLGRVASALQLGAEPATAWSSLAGPGDLGWLARTVVRSVETGAPLAATLDRAARELRSRRRAASDAAARAVAVKAVAPLGACFLPAFLLLGIVPTVWGIASQTFAGWR